MTRHLSAILALVLALGATRDARAIIEGVDAADGDYPWMAGVIRKGVVPGPGLIGGGTLVGNQWVVTTAHSVVGLTPSDIEVWLGTHDLEDASSRTVVQVLAIVRHPDFAINGGTSTHDLALLLLDRRLSGITPAPVLEDAGDLIVGDSVSAAGWGTVTPGLAEPFSILQEAGAEIVSEAEAEMTYGPILDESHLAAVDPLSTATPCVGDSGGPLVKNIAGEEVLVGLVSFGMADCDDASMPTVYTRISTFFSWIEERLGFTAAPPRLSFLGKSRSIRSGESPKFRKGTDFGALKGRTASRNRTYRLSNDGTGWLTIQSVTLTGRGFLLRRSPARVVLPGAATSLKVKLSNRSGKARYRGRLLLRTNQSDRPLYVVRLGGRSS